LIKKVTIITLPEYESQVLECLGRTKVTQLKEVTNPELVRLKEDMTSIDYKGLYEKVHSRYLELLELGYLGIEDVALSIEEQRRFADSPEAEIELLLNEMERAIDELKEKRKKLENSMAKLEAVRALEPEEFKKCIAVGMMKNEIISRFEEYLKRYPDTSSKAVSVSPDDSFLFVFGSEEGRKWVERLFLIFDVNDVFDVLETGDILLVLDPEKRIEAIEQYEEEVRRIKEEMETLTISKIVPMDRLLNVLSDDRAPILRTKVISVLQGWIPEKEVPVLEKAIGEIESKIGERLFVWFEDPSPEEHNIPSPTPNLKPSFLQPAWTLTSLRGWPSIHEINPSYITILIFSFQFGIMFGDVGQGAIFLLLGLIFTWKFKKGMASKIGAMFIPMGITSIIFGFLYGEVFLVEGLIHPILFSPLDNIGKLMKMVLGIAVIEMCIGLIIGAINHIKEGEPFGAIGEHGAGAILFIVGLYLGGLQFLRTGDISKLFSHWTFYMMMAGLVLSSLEPLLTAIYHKNLGMEVLGEVIGALMMTFVEGLANFFSFLRIGAFTLAHASLAIAGHALSHFMGPGGLLIANMIAMTFEFMSCSVQSLRLLYYEFMSKFFQGGGVQFKPFRIRSPPKREKM